MRGAIDRATPQDARTVENLLDSVASWMEQEGIDQWTPGRFGKEVREVIDNGDLYVTRQDGSIIGCFMLETACPDWMAPWLTERSYSPSEALYLGRLAVDRNNAGRRLGFQLLRSARQLATDGGFAFLRLNCPSENHRLRRYYLDAGFGVLGEAALAGPAGEDWTCTLFEASLPHIDTNVPHLRLLALGPGQIDEYAELVSRNRTHLTRYGDYHELADSTRESLLADLQNNPDAAARYGIRLNGRLIGRVDLIPRDDGNFVLGYWLDKAHTGHGFASTACRALIGDARLHGAAAIWAGVTKGNQSSVSLLERLGFECVQDMGSYSRYRLNVGGAPIGGTLPSTPIPTGE
jgi:RimJ/RimL family protein N-acetyltransferase